MQANNEGEHEYIVFKSYTLKKSSSAISKSGKLKVLIFLRFN
jgi:hypothetical protein